MKKIGFTLIELLVVIVILGILITLGSKGLRTARLNAKKAQAKVEMSAIETAVKSYFSKYGKLPLDPSLQGASEPDFNETFSIEVIEILTGINSNINTAGLAFLDPQGNNTDGVFRDPWGEQYLIALDTDYDGRIDFEGDAIRRKVAIKAVGLYLMNGESNTNDLIATWH